MGKLNSYAALAAVLMGTWVTFKLLRNLNSKTKADCQSSQVSPLTPLQVMLFFFSSFVLNFVYFLLVVKLEIYIFLVSI